MQPLLLKLTPPTSTVSAPSSASASASWLYELLRDIIMGVSVGMVHPITLIRKWLYAVVLIPFMNRFFGLNLLKDKIVHSKDGEKTLKVVAVGYGRTGFFRHCIHNTCTRIMP